MECGWVDELYWVSSEVQVLTNFGEVFFDVSGKPKVVKWYATCRLEDDLELFLGGGGWFLKYFLDCFL